MRPAVDWQAPMVKVLAALAPLVAFAVYRFGWRVLVLLAACNAAGFAVERVFTRRWGEPVSAAVFVTGVLFVLSLPPHVPVWMAVAGVVFGVLFGKMVFGGFGRNVFNPALTGRAFIYVSFGGVMTAQWAEPYTGFPGGFGAYALDAVTRATPGILAKSGVHTPLPDLLAGSTAGVIGGTSAALTALSGLALVASRVASHRIVAGGLLGFALAHTLSGALGGRPAGTLLEEMLAGGFLLGIFFFATDPVTACQTQAGRWLYGGFIGAMSVLIKTYSAWPAGTMFAILLANMFAPATDMAVRALKPDAPRREGAA